MRRSAIALAASGALAFSCPHAFAGDLPQSYVVTAWSGHTGPHAGDILAITEDLDGFLWLATNTGLVRFDGSAFVPWATRAPLAPDRPVSAITGTRDGSVWIGYGGEGGVARVHEEHVDSYPPGAGLFAGGVTALIEDGQGTIWAGGRGGLSRFRDHRWTRIDESRGFPAADVLSVFEDHEGRLWFGTSAGIYATAGDRLVLRDSSATFVQHFAEDLQGNLWITDTLQTVKQLMPGHAPALGPSVREPQSGWRIARDRAGQLWIAALGGGLLRLEHPGGPSAILKRFVFEDRIGGSPRSVFYDREGAIWVGLRGGGLLRVSETSIAHDIPLDGLTNDGVRAMAAGSDGSIWIATGHALNHFTGREREIVPVAQTHALHPDSHGALLVSTAREFGRMDEGRFTVQSLPEAAGAEIRWENVMALATDRTDARWLCMLDQGAVVWRHDTLERFTSVPQIGRKSCSAVRIDRRGDAWIGFSTGGVAVVHPRGIEYFSEQQGLAGGAVLAIEEDSGGAVWVATRSGLSRYRDGRFATMTRVNGPIDNLVPALLEDASRDMWIGVNSGAAVLRFSAREMDEVARDPRHQIEYTLYDASDGMQGEVPWQQSRSLAARDADGRLWFATGAGVSVIDPRHAPSVDRARAPRIERVLEDGRDLPVTSGGVLSPGFSTLTLSWTSVSLGAASKLSFRYRLEGHDADWIETGAQRSVSYARLPAGRYRFRVSATNSGRWTDATSWEFTVPVPFYRRGWFLSSAAFALIVLVGAAWQLRLRAVREQHALVLAERAHVSREIHDTLLQNLAAIGMELETIVYELDESQRSGRDSLRRLQRQVGHSLREARDLVVALRHNATFTSHGLVESIRELADETSGARGIGVTIEVLGQPRRCSHDVELQLLRIAQEAVNNARRHGRATAIHITIDFGADPLSLRVADNGSGFDTDGPDDAEHLGLRGMEERADRIGGRLTIASTPGGGTTVSAIVPWGRS